MSSDIGAAALSKNGRAPERKPESDAPAPREWKGWKRSIDSALYSAGGALPWKRLRAEVVAHCQAGGATKEEDEETLGFKALAHIPMEYTSEDDPLVRLPRNA